MYAVVLLPERRAFAAIAREAQWNPRQLWLRIANDKSNAILPHLQCILEQGQPLFAAADKHASGTNVARRFGDYAPEYESRAILDGYLVASMASIEGIDSLYRMAILTLMASKNPADVEDIWRAPARRHTAHRLAGFDVDAESEEIGCVLYQWEMQSYRRLGARCQRDFDAYACGFFVRLLGAVGFVNAYVKGFVTFVHAKFKPDKDTELGKQCVRILKAWQPVRKALAERTASTPFEDEEDKEDSDEDEDEDESPPPAEPSAKRLRK
jgi:hypothetical protein